MKTVKEFGEDCLAVMGDMQALDMPLAEAIGAVLESDALAQVSLPPVDMASIDGYAIRSLDLAHITPEKPVTLPVVGEIRAGEDSFSVLPPGHAMRVWSGSRIPKGADVVIPFEETDGGKVEVTIACSVPEGHGVRYEAEDFEAGLPVLEAGTRIGSRDIALLAAAGLGSVVVKPPPRVVVLTVGDELVEPGRTGHPGTVYDANGYGITTAIQELGATVFRVPHVPDTKQDLRDALLNQLVRADIIITTGGISAGGTGNLKEVLAQLGDVRFDRVAVAPLRQYGVGTIGREHGSKISIYCLPGSPVAALIGYELFVRPALRRAVGHRTVHHKTLEAEATAPWTSTAGLDEYIPVRVAGKPTTGYRFEPTGIPGAELLYGLARANAFAIIPATQETVAVGDRLTCLILD